MSNARDKVTTELLFPTVTQADVDEWHDQWHRMHPETKAFQRTCELAARSEGFTATPIGSYRKRFFVGGANKPGATFNHVIQGAASDCANDALRLIAEKIPYGAWGEFSGLCGQVHDWLGVYVPIEREAEAIKIVEDAMNRVVFGVSISASAKASQRWSDQ
jgi:DNA polymerase I-like protein with 3'-5' exonuclease and polymerase domains